MASSDSDRITAGRRVKPAALIAVVGLIAAGCGGGQAATGPLPEVTLPAELLTAEQSCALAVEKMGEAVGIADGMVGVAAGLEADTAGSTGLDDPEILGYFARFAGLYETFSGLAVRMGESFLLMSAPGVLDACTKSQTDRFAELAGRVSSASERFPW